MTLPSVGAFGAVGDLPHARSVIEHELPLPLCILVMGDSVSAGRSASSYHAAFPWLWAHALRERHKIPVRLVNLSAAGQTSADGRELVEVAARQYQPDVAVLAFGLNDLREARRTRRRPFARGPRVPVDRFRENILRTADCVRRRSGADVIIVSPWCAVGTERYRDALADITSRTEFVLADVGAAWPADGTGVLDAERAHPNDAGHRIYAEVLCGVGL
jgi:lysophospholipase L1-like esterase